MGHQFYISNQLPGGTMDHTLSNQTLLLSQPQFPQEFHAMVSSQAPSQPSATWLPHSPPHHPTETEELLVNKADGLFSDLKGSTLWVFLPKTSHSG